MLVPLSKLMDLPSSFCLVIGNPIEHSLSPLIHNLAFDYHRSNIHYYAVNINSDDFDLLPGLFARPQFAGANVTIPFKTCMKPLLDYEDETAYKIGAVNTIIKKNGRLEGHNTDAYGFNLALEPYQERLKGKKAIVLGSGGVSKAVVYGLTRLGMKEIAVFSRNPDRAAKTFANFNGYITFNSYQDLPEAAANAELIVNATPIGMEPDLNVSPVPRGSEHILAGKICYDIVYKPLDTLFLKQARNQNAIVIPGLDMFIGQAAKAFELWTGKQFPYGIIKDSLSAVLKT